MEESSGETKCKCMEYYLGEFSDELLRCIDAFMPNFMGL